MKLELLISFRGCKMHFDFLLRQQLVWLLVYFFLSFFSLSAAHKNIPIDGMAFGSLKHHSKRLLMIMHAR